MGVLDDIKRELANARQQANANTSGGGGGVGGVPARIGAAPSASNRRLAIVCCMDPRLRPELALGVPVGGAILIRNTGGTVTAETLYALQAACDVFGVREIVVLGHSDCAFAYDASGQWDTAGARAALVQAEKVRAWSLAPPRGVTVRAMVVPNLALNRAVAAETALAAPAAGQASPPPPVSPRPGVASTAVTQRVGGRLERENLVRVPPAPPAMPPTLTWEQKNPSSADFQRKVAEMTRSEAQALNVLPDGSTLDYPLDASDPNAAPEPGGLIGSLDARALVRSITLGEVLDEPKGRRAFRPHPK